MAACPGGALSSTSGYYLSGVNACVDTGLPNYECDGLPPLFDNASVRVFQNAKDDAATELEAMGLQWQTPFVGC